MNAPHTKCDPQTRTSRGRQSQVQAHRRCSRPVTERVIIILGGICSHLESCTSQYVFKATPFKNRPPSYPEYRPVPRIARRILRLGGIGRSYAFKDSNAAGTHVISKQKCFGRVDHASGPRSRDALTDTLSRRVAPRKSSKAQDALLEARVNGNPVLTSYITNVPDLSACSKIVPSFHIPVGMYSTFTLRSTASYVFRFRVCSTSRIHHAA
ncbi:hypothetical protein BC629DRAFT_622680 [Irpex lacteus]|nr:hypothetical protein BC629DRAFT_622680 [Irpex lacteus]